MNAFVLDCSATVPWAFETEASDETDMLLAHAARGAVLHVPALWHLELGNVLLGAKRRGRIDQAGLEEFVGRLRVLNVEVDSETIPSAWSKTLSLADAYDLTVYDAAYLELSLRKGLPLATLDIDLQSAMKRAGGTLLLRSRSKK